MLGESEASSSPPRASLESRYRIRLWRSASEGLSSVPETESSELRALALSRIESVGLTVTDERGARPLDVVVSPGSLEQPAVSLFWGLAREARAKAEILVPELPPPDAPSRAYSKLKEVVSHLGLTTTRGETVLELGAAPGGASLALLEYGLNVLALDPAQMDPNMPLLAARLGSSYAHIAKKASALERADLKAAKSTVTWLVSDINLAPPVALTQLSHALALVKRTVKVIVVTFKINDERALLSVDTQLARLQELTGIAPICVHLPSHRCEFGVVLDLSKTA